MTTVSFLHISLTWIVFHKMTMRAANHHILVVPGKLLDVRTVIRQRNWTAVEALFSLLDIVDIIEILQSQNKWISTLRLSPTTCLKVPTWYSLGSKRLCLMRLQSATEFRSRVHSVWRGSCLTFEQKGWIVRPLRNGEIEKGIISFAIAWEDHELYIYITWHCSSRSNLYNCA